MQRAINRAWTDYLPTFSELVTGLAYAGDEAATRPTVAQIPGAFERVEGALEKQSAGPFFNGAKYSLVDAAYAPFLQRYVFLDRIRPLGVIGKFPRLKAWTDTLMKRPSTHSFPEAEFEALYRLNVKRRKNVCRSSSPTRRSRRSRRLIAPSPIGRGLRRIPNDRDGARATHARDRNPSPILFCCMFCVALSL